MRRSTALVRRWGHATWLLACTATAVHGQAVPIPAGIPRLAGMADSGTRTSTLDLERVWPGVERRTERADGRGGASPWAILASAAVAGSGQALLGQDRFLAYFAIEAFAWARYAADSRQGRRERRNYRRLAALVARAPFTANPRDGDWDYYERMEHFVESGAFDLGTGGEFVPEVDTSTYNGALWLLARQTYWKDPATPPDRSSQEWRRAEQFYRGRAITPDRRWSWRNALLEYDEFRRMIRRSNEGLRRSLTDIGIVIANHALSTVDAFVTVRLRDREATRDGSYQLEIAIPFELRR